MKSFFAILSALKGLGQKTDWAWSYSFETQNKQNAFLPFILKEHGSKNIQRKDRAKKVTFRTFTCTSEPKKGVALCAVIWMNFDLKIFVVIFWLQEQQKSAYS